MKTKLLFATMIVATLLAACKGKEEPIEPDPEPTPVDTSLYYLDTTYSVVDTFRLDTVRIDTITTDTLLEVQNDMKVVGYVSYYSTKMPVAECCTHIHYAFGELYMDEDSNYVKLGLKGTEAHFLKVLALKKKNPNLKICLSINHSCVNADNAQHGGFSVMSAHPAMRKKFAQDCRAMCEKYGLDGIDIDWEFPGLSWSGSHCDPAHDVANYTLLMQTLSEELHPEYTLSYAAYLMEPQRTDDGTGWKYIDNMAVEPYVDYVNLMTYDICSAPQPHNAMSCSGYWDILRTYQSYLAIGYPMEKLVLGIPFYGRHTWDDGEQYYWKIKQLLKQYPNIWTRGWGKSWKVPCLKKNGTFFCSYDDPESIALKGEWVKEKGLGGLMYWEAYGDDDQGTLGHACWDAMKKERQVISEEYIPVCDTVAYQDTIMVITKHYIDTDK